MIRGARISGDKEEPMTTETVTDTITPEGDDLARQTAQAKMLREARDELAKRARELADAKNRKALQRMGLSQKRAAEILDGAPFTSEDMADILGVSLRALIKWLAPGDAPDHREMPETAKRLLSYILRDDPRKRSG